MKIELNSKSKVQNPMDHPNNTYSFEGPFDADMFGNPEAPQFNYLKHQKANLEKINNIITNMGLQFEYIWLGSFDNYKNNKSNNFILKTGVNPDGKQIYWHKYSTMSPGSGQNWIYVIDNDNKLKTQLSKWLITQANFLI